MRVAETITRDVLARRLNRVQGLTLAQASGAVDCVFETVAEGLLDSGHVELRGFGSLTVVRRKATVGRNPKNPEVTVRIPERNVVVFRAGESLRNELAKGVK